MCPAFGSSCVLCCSNVWSTSAACSFVHASISDGFQSTAHREAQDSFTAIEDTVAVL